MALFRKNDSFQDLAQRLQNPGAMGPSELTELIQEVVEHPEANPRRLGWMVSSSNPRIRDAGIQFLLKTAPRDAMDLLLRSAISGDRDTRRDLAKSLLELDRNVLRQQVHRLFQGRNPENRQALLEIAAVDSEWREWLSLIKLALRTTDQGLRRTAARMVRRHLADPTARAILRALVHDENDGVRGEAIRGFCERPDAEIVEPFFARLPHESQTDQGAMIQALGELSRTSGVDLEDHLFPVLADESPTTRELAVRLLAQIPDKTQVMRNFMVHCRGLVSWLRDRAINSMLTMGTELASTLTELIRDPDEDIRVSALTLAKRLGDRRVLPVVAEVFRSDADWWIRSIATEILASMPTERTVPLLKERLDDSELRFSVVSALGQIDSPESTQLLIDCLKDDTNSVRASALEGLSARDPQLVLDPISFCARDDRESSVRSKALQVLRELGDVAASRVAQLEAREAKAAAAVDTTIGIELEMTNSELNGPESPRPH